LGSVIDEGDGVEIPEFVAVSCVWGIRDGIFEDEGKVRTIWVDTVEGGGVGVVGVVAQRSEGAGVGSDEIIDGSFDGVGL